MNAGPRTSLGFVLAVAVGVGLGVVLAPALGRAAWFVGAAVGGAVDLAMRLGRGGDDGRGDEHKEEPRGDHDD